MRTPRSGRWRYVRAHIRLSRPAMLMLLFWSAVEAVPIVLSGWLVSRAVDDGFLAHRTLVGLGLLACYGALELMRAVAERLIFPIFADIVEPMRDGLVTSVVASAVRNAVSSGTSHNAEPDSAVVARLTGHVEIARNLISALLRLSRPLLISVVSAAIGLATVAPELLVLVLPALALAALIYPLSWRAADRRRQVAVLAEEEVAAVTGRVIAGARDVIATGGAQRATSELRAASDADVRARNSLARLVGIRVAIDTVGGRLPLLIVVIAAPTLIRNHALSPGQLLGAITYLSAYLAPAVSTLNGAVSQYSTQLSAVIGRLQSTAPPATAPGRASSPRLVGDRALPSAVEFCGVDFGYGEGGRLAVENVSMTIEPAAHFAIVGGSGTGKSTVASLLAGVDRPHRGTVSVGGLPAVEAHAAGMTALVPQAAYLIPDTVRANLTYLNSSADTDRLDHAVTELGIQDLVSRLGGYDAEVRAEELSEGEKQLLVLARVFVSEAVVVVLDEATSHLDPAHELIAEQAFVRRPGTVVVVAHRLASAVRADRVLLLSDLGAECGTHAELMMCSSRYAQLFDAHPSSVVSKRLSLSQPAAN